MLSNRAGQLQLCAPLPAVKRTCIRASAQAGAMSLSDDSGEVQFCRSTQNTRRRTKVLAKDSDEENTPPAAVGKLHPPFAPAQGLFAVRNVPCTLSFAGTVHMPSQRDPFNAAGQGQSVTCYHDGNNSPCQPLTRPAASEQELCPPCGSTANSLCGRGGDGAVAETSPQSALGKHTPADAQEAASLSPTPCTVSLQATPAAAAVVAAADWNGSPYTPTMPDISTAAALDIDDPFTPWLRTARKQGRSTAPGSSNSRQQIDCELSSPMSISSSSSMASWPQDLALDDMVAAALSPTDLPPAAAEHTHVVTAASPSSAGAAQADLAASAAAPTTEWLAAMGWASAAAAAIPTCNQPSPLLQPAGQSIGGTPAGAADFCIDDGPVWTPNGATGTANLLTQFSAAVSLMCSSIDSPSAAQALTPVPFQSPCVDRSMTGQQDSPPAAAASGDNSSEQLRVWQECSLNSSHHSQPDPLDTSSPQAAAATKQREAGGQSATQGPASLAAACGDAAAAAAGSSCPAATAAVDEDTSVQLTVLHETADLTASRAAAAGNLYSSDSDDEGMQLTSMRRRPSKEAAKSVPQQPADDNPAAAGGGTGVLAAHDQQASAAHFPVLHETADLTATAAAAGSNLYSSDSDDEDRQLTFMHRRPSREAQLPISPQSAKDSDSSGVASSSCPSCSGRDSTDGKVELQGIATVSRGYLADAQSQPVAPSAGQLLRESVNRASIGKFQAEVAAVAGSAHAAEPGPILLQLPVQRPGGSNRHSTSSSDDDEDNTQLTLVRRRVSVAGEAFTEGRPKADLATDRHINCSGTLAAEDDKHLCVLQKEAVCPVGRSIHPGHSVRGSGSSSAGSRDSADNNIQLLPQPKQYTRRGMEQLGPQHDHSGSSKGNSSSSSSHHRGSSSSDDDEPIIFSRRKPCRPADQTTPEHHTRDSSRSSSSTGSSTGGDSNRSSDNSSDDSADSSSDFSFNVTKRKANNHRHTSSITHQPTQQIAGGRVTPQARPGRITPGSSSSLVARRRRRRGPNEAAPKSQQQQQQSPWCQQGEVDSKGVRSTPLPAAAAAGGGCDPYDFEAVMAALTPPNTISACVKTPGMALAYNSSCDLSPCAEQLSLTPAATAAAPWSCAHPSNAATLPAAATAAPAGARRLSFGLSPVSTPMLKPQVLFGAAAAATGIAGRSVLSPSSVVNSGSIIPAAAAGSFKTPTGALPAGGKGTGRRQRQQPVGAATAPAKAPTSRVFARQRQQLAQQLYDHWNAQVFDGALPAQLPLVWNTRLTATAGQVVDDGSQNTLKTSSHERIPVRLELSTKVLDTEVRLRTTLGHEMCHVAAWAISKEFKQHHGPAFWMWAKRFEERIAGIKITTCHNYEIHAPFRWQCMNTECGKQYHRHKCSIDPNKHVCSRCNGRLMFLGKFSRDGKVLSTTRSSAGAPAAASKTPGAGGNVFSQFVKTHFASVKKELPAGTPHKEVMSRLASQYKQQKTAAKTQHPPQQQIEMQQDSQQQKEQHPQQPQQQEKGLARPQQQQFICKRLVDEAMKMNSSSLGRQPNVIDLLSDNDSASDAEQQQQQSQHLDGEEASLLSFMKRLDLAG